MTSLPVLARAGEVQDNERLTAAHALHDALDAARDYALASRAENTVRAYKSAFADFCQWCVTVEQSPLPASAATLSAYLAHLAERGRKAGTIRHRLAAITQAHKAAGHVAPTADIRVQAVHKGIRRRLGVKPVQKAPATAKAIAAMIRKIPDTLAGKRDRALLLIGFAGALRRSELVALNVEDIETAAGGVLLHIRRSKTDQDGRGQTVPIVEGRRLMPVAHLRAWLSAANLTSGPIFRPVLKGDRLVSDQSLTPQSVALIIKKYAKLAKLDAAEFSGHSLRAGLVTEALAHGADVFAVADQGRWRKLETVREYDRRAKALSNNVGSKFL